MKEKLFFITRKGQVKLFTFLSILLFSTGSVSAQFPAPYCNVTFPDGVEPITRVVIGTIDNASPASGGPALQDFLSVSTAVIPGESYPVAVEGNTDGGWTNYFRVYIDWNQDGDFLDAGEEYTLTTIYNSTGLDGQQSTGTITVPLDALPGSTRMRVLKRFGGNPGSCNNTSYGQGEDYTIDVFSPDAPPAPTQVAGTPTCTDGTDIEVAGTPGANETWYWQTTVDGTSTANNAVTPWTVFENGTYYVRTHNSEYDVWSVASSITITNIPVAPAPPVPVAAQNPACEPGTDITVPAAPAGIEYYWQGTSNTSSSTAENASAPYAVTATGTYYVKAFEPATGCWSEAVGISVTVNDFIPDAPTVAASVFNICSGAVSQLIEAEVDASSSVVVQLASSYSWALSSASLNNSFSVPSGAVITSATLTFDGVTSSGAYLSELGFSATGAITSPLTWLGGDDIPTNVGPLSFPVTVTGEGTFTLNLVNYWTFSTTTVSSIVLTVNYDFPSSVSWYDAAASGTLIGTGSPFETVSSSVIASPAPLGNYEFYAESYVGGCVSTTRTLVTVNVNDVNVEFSSVDASCNNGNDGSFVVSAVLCGVQPFSFSVDGGAFGPVPSDLTAGSHTVIVQDVNGNESAEYTIVVGSADGPDDVTVDSYNDEEVTVSWTVNGSETEWNIEWGAPGFTPGTGAEIGSAVVTANPYTMTGLDSDTEYDIYVSANCGAGTTAGDWASTDVLTDCASIPAISWCEDFEPDSQTLHCWSTIDGNGDGYVSGSGNWEYSQWTYWSNTDVGENIANSGEYFAINFNQFTTSADDWLITPRLTLTGNEVLTFYYGVLNTGTTNFKVLLSTTGKNPADFTEELMAENSYSNETFQDTSVVLSSYAGNVYIAFVRVGTTESYTGLMIDDVCVDICTPVPGIDGSADVCRLDGTVDLNTVITSDYTHGTWSFAPNPGVLNGSEFNISTLANGSYNLEYIVTTACTADTTWATVNVFNPSSAGENGVLTACKNQMIDLYGGLSGNVDFGGTWYNSGGTVLSGSYFQTGTLVGQAVYRYVVSNGVCDADTSEVIVDVQDCDFLGLDDIGLLDNANIAPNPNTGNFQILGIPGSDYLFEVLDLNGRVVREAKKITSTTTDVHLTDVENGVYMIRITGNNSERMIRVIKH